MAAHRSYGELKRACVDAIEAELAPIRRRHAELMSDLGELQRTLSRGAQRARAVAGPVFHAAQAAIGVAGR